MNNQHPWQLRKKNWAVLGLPAKQYSQSSQIYCENGPNGLDWQCCLAGSSKTAPRILIFSITMSANYSLELISIETYVPQFLGPNDFFLGSVQRVLQSTVILDKGVCKISENGSAKKLPGSFCLFQKNARHVFFPTILGTVRLLDLRSI